MACNAWNHPSDCSCGWGGTWHGNYNLPAKHNEVLTFYSNWWKPERRSNYESYVNPNASCPVCSCPVYFFQSSNGGRVFFDELGPPWPKHPCTDNSEHLFNPNSYFPSAGLAKKKIKWQEDGWEPVEILNCLFKGKFAVVKIKRIDSDGFEFYLGAIFDLPLARDALVFIRETDDLGVFDFSYLDTLRHKIEVRQVKAYRNCFEIIDYECWESANEKDVSEDQNKVAFNLLFLNEPEQLHEIPMDDKTIDFDAVKFWLDRAKENGLGIAAENLKMFDLARLKNRLHERYSLKAEDFLLARNKENGIAAE